MWLIGFSLIWEMLEAMMWSEFFERGGHPQVYAPQKNPKCINSFLFLGDECKWVYYNS